MKQSNRKNPGNHDNCVTVERDSVKASAKRLVKEHNLRDKGKVFERIPIFRGYIEREVKNIT